LDRGQRDARDARRDARVRAQARLAVTPQNSGEQERSIRSRLRRLAGRAPSGQNDPRWLGAAVDLDAVRASAADGGLQVERIENPGTQYCLVLVRRPAAA
jgi:hypothetical protein